jgi:hypothetical protein
VGPTVATALIVLVVGVAVQMAEDRGVRIPVLSAVDDALERSSKAVAALVGPLCVAGVVYLILDPVGVAFAIPAGVAMSLYAGLGILQWRRGARAPSAGAG